MVLWEKYKGSYLSYLLMYNFYYLAFALFSVLISIYLLDKGFLPSEVSLVVSSSFFTSMLGQPAIGVLSDNFGNKIVNTILFTLAGIGGIYFMFANSLVELLIGYSFVMTLINGTNPSMEKIATLSKFKYGSIRIWGTLGFASGSQLSGLIYDKIAPEMVYVAFVLSIFLSIIGVLGTEEDEATLNRIRNSKNKTRSNTSALSLFKNKPLIIYILIAGIFYGATSIGNIYIAPMLENEGIRVSLVSTILSVAVLIEMPIVFFSHKFMDKIANKKLLFIAFIAVVIQTFIYWLNLWTPSIVLATLLFKHPPGMLFVMINLKVVNTLVDEDYQITALALIQTFRNLSSIIFQNLSGQILNFTTYQNLYLLVFIILLLGLIIVSFYQIPSGNDKKTFS
ncbi:MFS transporter [Carnobacteriaceae bacterium 52-44]